MRPRDDTAIVAIRDILTRLCKRSGLSHDRLTTTEIDITPLLDLPVIRRHAEAHHTTRLDAVLPVTRELARRLPPTYRVIADAELSLGLLRDPEPTDVDLRALYSQDLGARREYLSAHWHRLHEIADADTIPPAPTVRSLRATPERRAFTALAALMVTGALHSSDRFDRAALFGAASGLGTLTVIGDAVIDHVYQVDAIPDGRGFTRGRFSESPGGKGLNCVIAAARLGIDVRFVTTIGDDDAGRRILDYLRAENIDTSLVKIVPKAATPVTALIVNRTGVTGTIACTDDRIRLTDTELDSPAVRSALASSDAVLLTLEPPIPVIEHTLAAVRSLPDQPLLLVTAASIEAPQILYRYLPAIDYLIGSTRELDYLVPEVPATSGPHIAELLQMLGARAVCVVEDFGCTVRSDRVELDIPRFQATAFTDIPGARSAFTGALTYRLLSQKQKSVAESRPERAQADEGDFTWATAAMVATQAFAGDIPGTMPKVDEIDRIVRLTSERH